LKRDSQVQREMEGRKEGRKEGQIQRAMEGRKEGLQVETDIKFVLFVDCTTCVPFITWTFYGLGGRTYHI
jgi:hypothetical protein